MRSYHYLIVALALLFCFDFAVAAPQSLVVRQDEDPENSQAPSRTPAPSRSPSSVAQSEEPTVTRSQSVRPSQTSSHVDASSTPSVEPSSTVEPSNTASSEAQSSASSASDSRDPLPIHPKITPAMGLTGVILLLSGLVYTVIGIKNKWLYVFTSAAYLSSLAVTVLIVYLMNPPVSDAIQGAFFVAASLTGVIFGALSLVFADLTEGLGCLLGGFCLSMWFLTVKEDGLITSTTGRAIFIGCLSIAAFSLSFSHYTRTYGLIVCISFAGATVAMLGIDCLSRAGWKEFWLYLWNLNPDTFPLDTNSYPMTKGIRVELAGVILITCFGIISQLRLWKLVKEHREKNANQRLEQEQDLQREEEEAGRRIQDDFSRERAQWEAIYGEKSDQQDSVMDSSSGSTRKASASIKEREMYSSDSVEMVPLPQKHTTALQRGISTSGGKNTPKSTTVTVSVLRDENEIQQIDAVGKPLPQKPQTTVSHSDEPSNTMRSARASSDVETIDKASVHSTKGSPRSSVPPPPAIIPLPFTIPKEETAQSVDGDNDSVSAMPESVLDLGPEPRRFSKRLSGGSAMKRLSIIRATPEGKDDDEESLIVPHVEDDRASSVAATLDDDNLSLPDISPPQSPTGFPREEPSMADPSSAPANNKATGSSDAERSTEETKEAAAESSKAAQSQSLTISTDPKKDAKTPSEGLPSPRADTVKSTPDEEGVSNLPKSKSNKSGPSSVSSQTKSQVRLSRDVLPERFSKVALSYRTNEWAKHLEIAELPELDQLQEPESPTVKLQEQPAPVTNEVAGIEPTKAKRASKRVSSESSAYPGGLNRADSNTSKFSPQEGPYVLSRNPSAVAPVRISRTSSGIPSRNPSNPYLPQSPDPAVGRFPVVPTPVTGNTLMGKRESLVRNRFSSQSFQNASSPNLPATADQENMTLAQRKQLMQQQKVPAQQQNPYRKPPSTSQRWQQNNWAIGGEQIQGFDSHQPLRTVGGVDQNRREDMLANWRESIRQQSTTPVAETAVMTESQRLALINEKRQKEARDQQRAIAAQQRESAMGNMMRSGEMLDAHREAMRRMQSAANRNAS